MDKHTSSGPQWTEAQLRGITTTGHSVLVSAAAGSGKTAMLAERCAHLVCEAPEPCDVDELLVVTFTEAAAAEMKNRIHAALRKKSESSGSERLARQVALIDSASVSTLHSFCARMLREHFHVVGLDPSFSVLDGEEAGLLRREIAREVFDDRYEFDASGEFQRFIDAYGEGDDSRLIRRVIDTHEMLCSLVNPQAWIVRSRDRIGQAAEVFEHSELQAELKDLLARGIAETQHRCDRAMELIPRLGKFPVYMEALLECEKILRFWRATLDDAGIDALAEEVRTLELPRLKAVSNSIPNKELAKDALDSVRGSLTDGSWRDLLRFTEAQWQDGLRAIQPHAQVFLELVEEFGRKYRRAKDASRVVDFSDLERFAMDVLCDGPAGELRPSRIARGYHKQFAHVLVDEYQDINEVQDAILALLSRECVCDEPGASGNLFSVGDVKQSIYRFRLAEAARFLERQRLFREAGEFKRGEVIDLQSNFRSRGPLLNAINSVFERLMTADAADIEYDLTQRLHAGLKFPSAAGTSFFPGAPIELHLLPAELESEGEETPALDEDLELDRSEREAVVAAQRIRRITGLDGSPPMQVMDKDPAGGMTPRPARFGDIVILLRSMRYKSEQYADVLRRAGLPVHAQSATGYFESMEVRDMLALLSVLENQRQDIPLAAVLRSPLARLANCEDALTQIRVAFPSEGDEAIPFHDAVVRYAHFKDDNLAKSLGDFLKTLEHWRHLAHSRPLAEVIWTIYQESGYLAFCSGLHDGQQRVANLMDLHRRAGQFGSFSRQGLSRFMDFLEGLRDQVDLGQPSTASEADDVVRVMSIHRSKGLEFPVVILPDLGKRINLSDCQGSILTDRRAGLGMAVIDEYRMIRYPSLASVIVQRRLKQQALAEELRVLYVAMTRAREHLILIGTCKPDLPETWKNRWSDQAGAFPPDSILSARCMLDWLGPVAAATARASSPVFDTVVHSPEEVASWQAAHAKRPTLTPEQERLARLQPIDPPPAPSVEADDVIRRLEFRYPFEAFTRVAAVEAITRWGKVRSQVGDGASRELANPSFVAGRSASAADIGTATHLVLRHLDFSSPCDSDDVARQIVELSQRRIITAAQAEMVDRNAICWLAASDLGSVICAHARDLRREVHVHLSASPPDGPASSEPLDQVMLRGRIDLLVPTNEGIVLIDYKTDSIAAAQISARAESYLPQITLYARAIQQIGGKPIVAAHLVFLFPKQIWTLPKP